MVVRRPIWESFIRVLSYLHRFELWVPLLLYLALKLIILALYVGTTGGPLVSMWQLLVEDGFHEALVHYPTHLLLTPVVLGRLDYFLDIFIHTYLQGVTILLFAAAIQGQSLAYASAFKQAARRYLPLIILTIIVAIVIYAGLSVPGHLFPKGANRLFRLAGWGGATFVSLVIEALFLFAGPVILIEGKPVLTAIRRSFRMARQDFTNTMVLVVVPFALTVPAVYLGFKNQVLALRLSPEILPQIQIFSELSGFLSTLILIGGLTVVFYWRRIDEKKRP